MPSSWSSPPVSEHRLTGDGRSTALLRPNGEVDWWCAPDLDSPPVCWSLLDPAGGAALWIGMVPEDRGRGPVAGHTLRTWVRRDGVLHECWDALRSEGGRGTALIRLIRCIDADLDIEHRLRMGGFDAPAVDWWDALPTVGGVEVRVLGGESRVDAEGALLTRVGGPKGAWQALVISLDGRRTADVAALVSELSAADAASRRRSREHLLPRHFPRRAEDALAVVRSATYAPTGAVAAAVTTSLPEAPGFDRQFDYRFTWLRDAALAVSVAGLLGDPDIARLYLAFVHRQLDESGMPRAIMSTVRGEPVPSEREITGVRGWDDSLPIRVGNEAAGQVQYDALGMVLEAVSVYLQQGGRLDERTWSMVVAVADRLADGTEGPSSGIWELREPRMLVSADIGRWLALDRAIWIGRGWRPLAPRAHWKRARAAVRARVLGAITSEGGLPQTYGGDPSEPDASALMIPIFHLLPPRDGRNRLLVRSTLDALSDGPHVFRYRPGKDDGFHGVESSFVPMSWWGVSALAAVGEVDEARERAVALNAELPRLLPEEWDRERKRGLGNVPLIWAHIEAARAMYLLDAAVLRSRTGLAGLLAWRGGRYLTLLARRRRRRSRHPWTS